MTITPEQVNRMLALNNDLLALRAEGVGIISASPYKNEIHVDTETILAMPGELEVNEREKHEYPFEYVKYFGGKRFFALSKERIAGMSYSGHTPGPWEWIEDKFNGGYSGVVGKDNAEVLFPNHRNDGDDGDAWFEDFPSEADRNLIAAAPDMYEALRSIENDDGSIPNTIWEMAQKALAKAEGK